MVGRSRSGQIAVEISVILFQIFLHLIFVQHDDLFSRLAFAAGVGVFNNVIAVHAHHTGEAQGFSRERAVRIFLVVNRVKNTDEMKCWFSHVSNQKGRVVNSFARPLGH